MLPFKKCPNEKDRKEMKPGKGVGNVLKIRPAKQEFEEHIARSIKRNNECSL